MQTLLTPGSYCIGASIGIAPPGIRMRQVPLIGEVDQSGAPNPSPFSKFCEKLQMSQLTGKVNKCDFNYSACYELARRKRRLCLDGLICMILGCVFLASPGGLLLFCSSLVIYGLWKLDRIIIQEIGSNRRR